VELMNLSGLGTDDLEFIITKKKAGWAQSHPDDFYLATYVMVERLGEMANTLKLKPWKSTAMLTDGENYKRLAKLTFNQMTALLGLAGFNDRAACGMYLRKNAVNQFRQNSNY
jgi:hypothetical protein